ncbi:MAG: RsmF rRNA methyltransferase first C-terminal domain-containing protein, partial [Clostridia bacterium]
KIVPDYEGFIDSFSSSPIKSFFINNNKISNEQFLSQNTWDITPCAEGYILNDDIKVGKTPQHHAGMIYMQELSAMMPATFLPLNETDWVIDLCASPGGKSIQVANKISKGVLISNEIVRSRANVLKSNIERMGLTNVIVSNNEPKMLENYFTGVFDAVIADAPCSGEGMFRKDSDAILNWSQQNVEACAIRQKAILETANKLLKANGYLLYSTCTFSVEEDEQVVADFCSKYNYEIIPIKYDGATNGIKIDGFDTHHTLRFYPHKFNGEGQFVALLKKLDKTNQFIKGKVFFKPLLKFPTEYKLFKSFCEQNLTDYDSIITNVVYNNSVIYYLSNKQLAESGINLVNAGVIVGEIVKGRFEPNHNLATCFGNCFKHQLDVDEVEAYQFLKGETLPCQLNGFVAVKFNNVVLGFGKSANGVLKNHYPKGLRNNV